MARQDLSDKLIHFTSGSCWEEAFYSLRNIISEQRLIGSNVKIKGRYKCICFTKAPIPSLSQGLVNTKSGSRYSPFGMVFDKLWIFKRGGRPVIYQPDDEFSLLPEGMRWRHVRYEPIGKAPIDFTWEREWRIKCDDLPFTASDVSVIVPNAEWAEYLIDIHNSEQDFVVEMYATAYSREEAESVRDPFLWHILTLN